MKTIKTNQTTKRLTSEIDLFSDVKEKLTSDLKSEITEQVGEYLKEQILLSVADSSSPISGGEFKKTLSPKYKKEKEKAGLPGKANLEFSGDMLDSLTFKPTSKGLEIGVFGEEALRADGHNNFTGKSKLPTRQFLPKEGENFKQDIKREVDRILRDKLAEQVDYRRSTFATIRTKEELFQTLRELLPGFTRVQIVEAVLRNEELFELLDEFNLVRFLRG
jgi:phage gpG-like protein